MKDLVFLLEGISICSNGMNLATVYLQIVHPNVANCLKLNSDYFLFPGRGSLTINSKMLKMGKTNWMAKLTVDDSKYNLFALTRME
jgi:hypothetical protein